VLLCSAAAAGGDRLEHLFYSESTPATSFDQIARPYNLQTRETLLLH
jgi:hypothetical protein